MLLLYKNLFLPKSKNGLFGLITGKGENKRREAEGNVLKVEEPNPVVLYSLDDKKMIIDPLPQSPPTFSSLHP